MEKGFLKASLLPEFLDTLRVFGELHGPTVSSQGVALFAPISDPAELRLDYRRTLIPPKKYLLPFREDLLQYRDGLYQLPEPERANVVLFGIHPCDLQGIAYLDLVFLGNEPDHCYARRRSHLILVGISCVPDDFCFCSPTIPGAPCDTALPKGSGSAGARPPSTAGCCDLFLTAVDEGYQVTGFSPRGSDIMEVASPLLEPSPGEIPASQLPCPIPPQDPQLRFSDNPLWEEFAERCVSCGACSVCCPTCYCFDVREYPNLTGGGHRLREWDNCLFATHGEVAGANFRPSRLDRLRYRFLHKYCGFSPLEGIVSCVGCGRCRKACPVDIDLRELFGSGDRRP